MGTTRRTFLQLGTATAAALVAGFPRISRAGFGRVTIEKPRGDKPRRVIFLVSDGMSIGALSMADVFSGEVRGRLTHFGRLLSDNRVAHGYFETHSLNSVVTDSAAASSAWGSGSRVFNSVINQLPTGEDLTPIMKLLQPAGIGTGLVTTATVTHATPAGFAAVSARRGDESGIAPQYNGTVDVVLGGGRKFFDAAKRADKRDVAGEYAAAGYTVVRDRAGLAAAPREGRLLGTFFDSHLPYTVDHQNDDKLKADVPTLAEMTEAALAILDKNPKGFLLQVEGARVDHAAHNNDAAGLLWDQLAFDDALAVALAYQEKNPDTLVIVTSDHGNANPGINGMGAGYGGSTEAFRLVGRAKGSYERFEDELKAMQRRSGMAPNAPAVRQLMGDLLGITLSPREAEALLMAQQGSPMTIHEQHANLPGIYGHVTGNHNGVGWTGTSHTQDYTVIAAQGPGQEHFARLMPNTALFGILTGLYGIEHRNPTVKPEQLSGLLKSAPGADGKDPLGLPPALK